MLVIFRQTYKKMIFSLGTIVMFILSLIFFPLILIAIKNFLKNSYFQSEIANITIFGIVLIYYRLFMLFIFPLYVTINSVKFISDEIKNGSFLIYISKPVSRINVISQKFLALIFTNMSFCIATLAFIWFYSFRISPSYEMYDVMIQVVPTMLLVSFLIQLFLSILLTIISIRFNGLLMIGIGIGMALVAQIWPRTISNNITKNASVQKLGIQISQSEYPNIVSGQKIYKRFIRPFSFVDHMAQIYWDEMGRAYKKYDLQEIAIQMGGLNREAIIKKRTIEKTNALGNIEKRQEYFVSELKLWIPTSSLKLYYFIASILLSLYGIYYFNNKDIT